MYQAGSPSWRFMEDDAQFLHLALFMRDAAGWPLPVRMTSRHHWLGRCPARLHTSCCTTSSPPTGGRT
jgi:hypothetical protein